MPQTDTLPRLQNGQERERPSSSSRVEAATELGNMSALRDFRTEAVKLQRHIAPERETTTNKTLHSAQEACAAADRLSEQMRQTDRSSPQFGELQQRRDLLTHCLIANDVYSEGSTSAVLPAHISRLRGEALEAVVGSALKEKMLDNDKTGYFGAVYLDRESFVFILANRGSENLSDWINNVQQASGFKAQQYSMAIEAAIALKAAVTEKYGPSIGVVFNGHSLGGGLASSQALVTNSPAITFNAAGLNRRTVERYENFIAQRAQNIRAYRVKDEILTAFQDKANGALGILGDALVPEAAGQGITMDIGTRAAPVPALGLGESTARHKMGAVIRAALRATGEESPTINR